MMVHLSSSEEDPHVYGSMCWPDCVNIKKSFGSVTEFSPQLPPRKTTSIRYAARTLDNDLFLLLTAVFLRQTFLARPNL